MAALNMDCPRGDQMMRSFAVSILVALSAVGTTASVQAQTEFDMKGGWSGTGKSVVLGLAPSHPVGEPSKPAGMARLREVTFTYKIEGQDGPRFWGTLTSPYQTIPVIGTISADNKRVYFVDQNGMMDGVVVDNDTIDTCYRQLKPEGLVAACNLMRRTK
jgi:hypothetical protein